MGKIAGVIVLALVAAGASIFGFDQHHKRKEEQAKFRAELKRLKARLSLKETEFAELSARLGEKNGQVRTLAAEVQQLRAKVADAKRRAS